MRTAKIDSRELASWIHRFEKPPLDATGLRTQSKEPQTLAANSLRKTRRDDQQVRDVSVHDVTLSSVETITTGISSGDGLDTRRIPISIKFGDRQRSETR